MHMAKLKMDAVVHDPATFAVTVGTWLAAHKERPSRPQPCALRHGHRLSTCAIHVFVYAGEAGEGIW